MMAYQRRVLTGGGRPAADKQNEVMLRYRKQMWVKGSPADIKRGRYMVSCHFYDQTDKQCNGSLYDMKLLHQGSDTYLGWSAGLENNVAMTIAGKPVLAADNHNFAAPFIIDLINSGRLIRGARLIHVDRHSDVGESNNFDLKEYLALDTEEAKLAYILNRTDTGSWITDPLVKTGLIANEWNWIAKHRYFIDKWLKMDLRSHIADEFEKLADLPLTGNTIIDIDLDVLAPLDERLSIFERFLVGWLHYVPSHLKPVLDELAALASKGDAVMIANSPCYIAQRRAMVYQRYILDRMIAAAGQG